MERRVLLTVLALAACLAVISLPLWWPLRGDNAVARGWRLSRSLGCDGCHGALVDPLAGHEIVPALGVDVESRTETLEWIRDGFSQKLRQDGEAWERYRSRLIEMPAYGGLLSTREVRDLASFVVARSDRARPSAEAARSGAAVAQRHCEGCHNVLGAGGRPNPGSPFGYVPALFGPDFEDLVRDEEELREWITTGSSERIARRPLVTWWWRRQRISMPAFGGRLTESEIDALVAWIEWLDREMPALVER